MTNAEIRKHVAGLMLEAALHAEARPWMQHFLLRYAAMIEAGPEPFLDLGTSPYYYALQGAEPFLARASQDLFGAGGTTAQVRAALLRP